MIPVRLHLHNFMAYKTAETLNFGDVHIACLSGENGAGKSSLLDAITWALWGKARVSQMDSLVHLGETDMEVEFSFHLGDQTYRVLRRRTLTGRGRSELHFHVSDAGGWRTLTESSMRTTQTKIDRLLRLDYDTFINSAFLLQGRADEFTRKNPGERKQILAEILGLSIYDEYADRARDKMRHYQQEINIIEGQIAQIDSELSREAEYQAELAASRTEASKLKSALDETEHELNDLRQRAQELVHQKNTLEELQERLAQTRADIDALDKTITASEKKIASYEQTLAKREEIEEGFRALQAAQAELEDWNERLTGYNPLQEDKHRLQSAINDARARLETNIQNGESRRAELRPKAASLSTIQADLATLETALSESQSLEAERDTCRQRADVLTQEAADLKARNEQLKAEMDRINQRLTQLQEAESICPVCNQPLSESHRQQVIDSFQTEGKTRGDTYRTNGARHKAIQADLADLQATLKQTDQQLKKHSGLQAQQAARQQALIEAEQAQIALQEMEKNLAQWQQQLAEAQYEVEAVAQLAEIETALADLGYDARSHQAARKTVANLASFAEAHRQLEDAQSRLTEEAGRLEQDRARHTRLLEQTASDRKRVAELEEKTQALSQVTEALSKTSRRLDELQREERMARSAVGAAEQKLKHIVDQAKARGSKEEKLADLKESMGIYQELRTAFGKNGVQALLIENTIPELEDEANNTLSQMTDGRMNLQFITQRETKTSQNVIETLDIRIADEVGTRNYELYSGGEAFRINFAIRIALSKLLARRAGARLQTLIIDEGFGTQDAQGRERLVEAINKIQHEFEKIIVITHLEELKDVFPTRITVQKTRNGSTIILN